jgi:alkylation response protein AidB-like acyl-CoA dehydrogenase
MFTAAPATTAAPLASRSQALEAARALLPQVRERAARTEAERKLPAETIEALHASGLFTLVTPRSFGGAQLGFAALVEVAATLASACASTGWVYGVLTGHAWMSALFAPEAQQEVFADPRALVASVFRLSGKTTPVPGGYRLTEGEGRFCSGIDFSRWVIVGNAIQREGAAPEPVFMLVSTQDVSIVDDWYTAGLRGTGSRSIRIADTFVPEHRVARAADLARGTSPGAQFHRDSPAYAVPFPVGQPFSLIGTPLGLAQGALDHFADSQRKRFAAMSPEQAGEQGALFARVAQVGADIEAATALTLREANRLDELRDLSALTALDRTRIVRNLAYSAQACRYAVTRLFEAAGGSGLYDGTPLQRMWRDANSATAHTGFGWDQAASAFGRARLGVAPSAFTGPRR